MTLESTIICVDNSEFARNGDFTPSRFGVQQDVIQTICRAKIRANPENNVGLLAIAGKKPHLVNTLTQDTNKLLTGFANLKHDGVVNNFTISLRTAHLALKHRLSKNHRQRIVFMICSPLEESENEIIKLAKKLKKEKVNVDVVNFGEDEENLARLAKFIETLNGKNVEAGNVNCHLLNIPCGTSVNDSVRMSAICGVDPATAQQQGGMDNGFGTEDWMDDPNMDPDLALALRVSLEESRARQQQENQQEEVNVPEAIPEEAAAPAEDEHMGEDDAELMAALQMSLAPPAEESAEPVEDAEEIEPEGGDDGEDEVDFADMTEDQQIEYALRMSMQDAENDDEMKD